MGPGGRGILLEPCKSYWDPEGLDGPKNTKGISWQAESQLAAGQKLEAMHLCSRPLLNSWCVIGVSHLVYHFEDRTPDVILRQFR
jgi:hypothetical protein